MNGRDKLRPVSVRLREGIPSVAQETPSEVPRGGPPLGIPQWASPRSRLCWRLIMIPRGIRHKPAYYNVSSAGGLSLTSAGDKLTMWATLLAAYPSLVPPGISLD